MKKAIFLLLLALPVFILIFCTASTTSYQHKIRTDKATGSKTGFAVIELFTSQGCSSCPPADRLLGTYTNSDNVYALSFHVDYWNKLGWKDPFSNADFTQRQSMYAHKLNSDVYTPQAVVNGQTEMVGSDETNVSSAVNKFLSDEFPAQVNIVDVKSSDTEVSFTYALHGEIDEAVLNVALVENKITTSIRAGENKGVNLTNYNVVRQFKTIDPAGKTTGSISFTLPPGYNKSGFKIIAFVQLKKTYKIVAASKASL